MRKYIALAALLVATPLLGAGACDKNPHCIEDAASVATSMKPECKPSPSNDKPRFVYPSVTPTEGQS